MSGSIKTGVIVFLFITVSISPSASFLADIRNGDVRAIGYESILCDEGNFESFFNKFKSELAVQEKATMFPLQKMTVDAGAFPEPKSIETLLEESQVVFPIYPSQNTLEERKLRVKISTNKNRAKVILQKPDTDYLVYYFFTFEECWSLTRIEDWSL